MIDISASALAAQIFTGLVLGGIFVLLAIGLSLIFGLMTVVNFAHGALYMLGAYFGVFLLGLTKNFWLSLVVAPLMVFVLGLAIERVLVGLWLFLERTNVGLIIRAGSRDPLMVRALGLDLGRVWLLVFGIGAGLAGLAGILAGPMRPVYPEMGITMVIESFVVVVVGGMGSLLGAVVAGIIIGEVVSLTTFFAPKLSEIMVFVVMALVLLVRPSGLFGEAGLLE